MASDMGDHLGARRGYSGALKRWYVNTDHLSWRVQFNQNREVLSVNVTPRPVPIEQPKGITYETTDPPEFAPKEEDLPSLTYESAEQFIEEVREVALDHFGIEEAVLREAVRRELRRLL